MKLASICMLNANNPDESTEDFYKICTESGINGYCLKKFIEIQ